MGSDEPNTNGSGNGFPDLMSRARHGKIARLPRHLRQEINRRLDENQSGIKILSWINTHPEARQMLDRQFGGKPINLQNLSNWRRAGFYEWQRYQVAAEAVDEKVVASPDKSLQEAVINPLERVMAVECFAIYQQATDSVDAPTKFKFLCQALHQVNAMRRHEHRKAWSALREEKASYQFERFCRTPSHRNQSPSPSNQSQSHHIKVDQGEKNGGHPTSNTQSPTSNSQRNTNRQTPNTKEPSNSNLQSNAPIQPNPCKSDHIKVDQGGKIGGHPTSNTQHPTSNTQRNTNRQTPNTKESSNSNLQSNAPIQPNPGKSDHIKVDQGGKFCSRRALGVVKRPDLGSRSTEPAGTNIVSKAISEIFGAKSGGATLGHPTDSTIQRFHDSTTPEPIFRVHSASLLVNHSLCAL